PLAADEFREAAGVALVASCVLGGETLVVVVVAIHDDICTGLGEGVPERPNVRVAAVPTGAPARVTPYGHRCRRRRGGQIGRQPATLRRAPPAAAHEVAV